MLCQSTATGASGCGPSCSWTATTPRDVTTRWVRAAVGAEAAEAAGGAGAALGVVVALGAGFVMGLLDGQASPAIDERW